MAGTFGAAITAERCVPISGYDRTSPIDFDEIMLELICEEDISAAVLGVMVDGRVVTQRGYGWLDEARTRRMPPNAMMRIASVTKPLVAAVVRELIDDDLLALDDLAFALGQPGGGVLPIDPFPELGDERLKAITIEHLLLHRAGWDRSEAGELTYRDIMIAEAMDVPSPPGRENTLRYILGQPLQFEPGENRVYSNIGYLALGLIIEHVTDDNLINVIHHRVLRPLDVRRAELMAGRTLREDQHPLEPHYDDAVKVRNVFDPDGPRVPRPYGGWDHEARLAQGGLVTNTRTLLRVLEARYISGPDIGKRRTGREGPNWRRNHIGTQRGVSVLARQRADGVHYVIMLNKRAAESPSYLARLRSRIDERIDALHNGAKE